MSLNKISAFLLLGVMSLTINDRASAQYITREVKDIKASIKNNYVVADTVKINLETAIAQAVQNYPAIRAAMADKESKAQLAKEAQAERVPQLKIQEQVTYSSANSMVGTFWPNEGLAIPTSGANRNFQYWKGAYGQYSTAFLTGPIYAFGRINANVKQQKAQAAMASAEYQNEVFKHKVKVAEAYLYLLVYQQLERTQKQNLVRALDINSFIQASVNSGLKPGVDSSYSAAEVSKAKLNYLGSIKDEKVWQIKFGELIGEENKHFVLDTTGFNTMLPIENYDAGNIDKHPLLDVYENKLKADNYAAKEARRSYFPTIKYMTSFIARGSGISNTNDMQYSSDVIKSITYQRYNYLLGVYFIWDALGVFRTSKEYQAKKLEMERDNALFDEVKLSLSRQLESSDMQFDVAMEQAKEAPLQLNAAKSSFNQSKARYESGLGNLVELSQSLYLLTRAESDYSISMNNAWRALLSKAAARGDFDMFMTEIKQ